MNRTQVATIICRCISAFVLLGVVIWLIFGLTNNANTGVRAFNIGFINFAPTGPYSLVETHRIPASKISANNIDSIMVDWISGSVSVNVHQGDEIIISEYSRREIQDAHRLQLEASGNSISVEFIGQDRSIVQNIPPKRLEILVPYTLSESLEHFQITTVSGRIQVSDITSNKFSTNTVSGRIELRDINAQELDASTTSGRISLANVNAEDISLRTVSGRIETSRTYAQSIRSYTTSGRHTLSGSFSDVNSRSASGRIEITSSVVPESLIAGALSGRISVTVPAEGTPSVQYSTRSGRFRSDIPVILHSGSDAQFQLSTASGRISIQRL